MTNVASLNATKPALTRFLTGVGSMSDPRPVVKELERLANEYPYASGERKALKELVGLVRSLGLMKFLRDDYAPLRGRIRKLTPEMEGLVELAEQIARAHHRPGA